jgi:cysteine-S-conjugate beta-lyase
MPHPMPHPHTFDFDSVVSRHGSGSFKWDSNPDTSTLPMFVADMDFKAAPVILDALAQRLQHGVFGYTRVRDEYYEAINNWFARQYRFPLQREWIIPTIGIVPAISAILRALTRPGNGVIVQTPVYHCFFSSIRNLGCQIVENPLRLNRQDNEHYQIDFDDLEHKAADPNNRVLLLCHPHNPSGRVWSNNELIRIGDICARHQVTVVSDEIHCDLLFPGHHHQPFATLKPEYLASCITLSSPGKSFNIAGLQIANLIIADRTLRTQIQKALHQHEITGVNPFGVEALIAAYNHGQPWLDALNQYLYNNYLRIQKTLHEQLPQLQLYPQQSTYLAWIDCSASGLNGDELAKHLLDKGQLRISSGCGFLPEPHQHNHFIRLNFACPSTLLQDGLQRLTRVIRAI